MVKVCLACEIDNKKKSRAKKFFQVYNNRNKVSAKWALDAGFINNVPPNGYKRLKEKKKVEQKKGNKFTLQLPKSYANHYIYIWAAKDCHNRSKIVHPKVSYGLAEKRVQMNDVFGKLNNKAQITFKIQNPCVYKKGHTYPPHIHYKVAKKDCSGYTKDFYTMTYLGDIDKKETLDKLKEGKTMVLNALPCKYYAKHNIPGSYNLGYDVARKMNSKDIENYIKDILINYPKLEKMVKTKKIALHNIPIIVYCAHDKCDAGLYLANELLKHDFVNIIHYLGGINEYYKKKIY